MRIFYVTPEFIDPKTRQVRDGGLASYIAKITLSMKSAGCSVGVICYTKGDADECCWNGIDVYFVSRKFRKNVWDRIRWKFISKQKRRYLKSGLELARRRAEILLRKIDKKKKIDLIQYASWLSTGKYAGNDIPYCIRISSYSKLWQKYYGYNDQYEIDDEAKQFRAAKYLYGPSEYIAGCIKRDLNLDVDISIIETPYLRRDVKEDDSLCREITEKIGQAPYLLFFGTIGLLKGAREIADSCYEVLLRHSELNIVLVGKEAMIDGRSPVSMIKESAGEFANRILHFESQPHSTLTPVIRGAKGVMLPSRIDNLPNTCIESMGLGKIVIGSRGASFEQLIEDGVNGILCDAGDYQSLIVAVDRLMTLSDGECEKMSNAALARSKMLSPSVIVPIVLAYYKKIIKEWIVA